MTEETPKILERCTPRPAPAELRARTLSAVDRELARRRKPRWERAAELAVAASLIVGVGLNAWLWQRDDAREAQAVRVGQNVPQPARPDWATAALRVSPADVWQGNRYPRLLHEISQGRIPESL